MCLVLFNSISRTKDTEQFTLIFTKGRRPTTQCKCILCTPFSCIVTSPRQAGVFWKCPLGVALHTASPPRVGLCSSKCCAVPEAHDSAELWGPGRSPLLESNHVPWASSSPGKAVGSGLRVEQSCQGSLSSLAWVLNCYHWPPDANFLPFVFLF